MQRVQGCALAVTVMPAYPSGREIARRRVQITVTHSQDGGAEVQGSETIVTGAISDDQPGDGHSARSTRVDVSHPKDDAVLLRVAEAYARE